MRTRNPVPTVFRQLWLVPRVRPAAASGEPSALKARSARWRAADPDIGRARACRSAAQLQAPGRAGRGGEGERTASGARGLHLLGCVPRPARRWGEGSGEGAAESGRGRTRRLRRPMGHLRAPRGPLPDAACSPVPCSADAHLRLAQAARTRTTSCSPTGTAPLSAPRTCAAHPPRVIIVMVTPPAWSALTRVAYAAGPCPAQTALGDRIYSLHVHAGPSYPDAPPEVRFITRINMDCVDQSTGKVRPPVRHPRSACSRVTRLSPPALTLPCLLPPRLPRHVSPFCRTGSMSTPSRTSSSPCETPCTRPAACPSRPRRAPIE